MLASALPTKIQSQVFLVDDCLDEQELFAMLAEQNNFNLVSAGNGKEALAKLAKSEVDPDVIFVDLNMPHMGGAEFVRKLHDSGLATSSRIVIFSAAEKEIVPGLDKSLVWLKKPFNITDVMNVINHTHVH